MRKKVFMLGLVLILTLVGASSVFAATEQAYVSPSKLLTYTSPVPGQAKYGRYGLEVRKGQVKATLIEIAPNGTPTNVHDFTVYTTTVNAHYVDYYMKNGYSYQVMLKADPGTEIGIGYVRN